MYITAQYRYILRISVHFEHIRLSQQLNSISYLLSTLMYHLKFWLIITYYTAAAVQTELKFSVVVYVMEGTLQNALKAFSHGESGRTNLH